MLCGHGWQGFGCCRELTPEETYRCLDCDMPFHKACLRRHCADTDEKDARIMFLEGAVKDKGLIEPLNHNLTVDQLNVIYADVLALWRKRHEFPNCFTYTTIMTRLGVKLIPNPPQ